MAKSGIGTVLGKNARGGIDKLSNREARGDRRIGSTGRINKEEHIDTYKELSNPSLKQRSAQWAIDNGTVPGVIPATALTPEKAVKLPEAPIPEDPGNVVGSVNAAIAPGLSDSGFAYNAETGQWSTTATESTGTETTDPNTGFNSIFESYMKAISSPPNTLDTYNRERETLGIDEKQRVYNQLAGRLNSIVSDRDAEIIRLEGEGSDRDVPKQIYAGQVARVNREAAIQALPVQAQLAAAQGDLQMAQETLNTMYQIKSQDAQAEWSWQQTVAQSVFSFMNESEQRRLDQIMAEKQMQFTQKTNNISRLDAWSRLAVETGQSDLIEEMASIDPSDPDFDEKMGFIQSRFVMPKDPTSAPAQFETVKGDDGSIYSFNKYTGELIPLQVGGETSGAATSFDKFDNLNKYVDQALVLADASGASGASKWAGDLLVGDTKYRQLENVIDTLKVNALLLNTDADVKKFFGPQMSNRDTELMTSAGTTLNPARQSPTQMETELKDYKDMVNRARAWTYLGYGNVLNVTLTDPVSGDSQQVPVNYDTLTQAIKDGLKVTF